MGSSGLRAPPCSPTSSHGLRFALLLRGEPFRAGCARNGILYQQEATASYYTNLVGPLERRGHCVDVLLSVHGDCGGVRSRNVSSRLLETHLATQPRPDAVRAFEHVRVADQGHGIRSALALFDACGGTATYDVLLLGRHDVRLLQPVWQWQCDLQKTSQLHVAGRCSNRPLEECAQDYFIAVPRVWLPRFIASVRTPLAAGASWSTSEPAPSPCECFDSRCKGAHGHDCARVLITGSWPTSRAGIKICAASVENTFERGVTCPFVAMAYGGPDGERALRACRKQVRKLASFRARGQEQWCAPSG